MEPLYKIASAYADLMAEGFDLEMIEDTLEGIEGEFESKVEQLLSVIKNKQYHSAMLKAESDKLAERSKHAENEIERIKAYISECMGKLEKKTINAGIHSITVRVGSKSVEVENVDLIPDEFVTYDTVSKVDKNEIKKRLNAGEVIAGVTLKTGKSSLIIK